MSGLLIQSSCDIGPGGATVPGPKTPDASSCRSMPIASARRMSRFPRMGCRFPAASWSRKPRKPYAAEGYRISTTLVSGSTRATREGGPRCSTRSASPASSMLMAASGSGTKRQTTRSMFVAAPGTASSRSDSPGTQAATRYFPLPTTCASAVSPAHCSRGIASQMCAGRTRTCQVASYHCSG